MIFHTQQTFHMAYDFGFTLLLISRGVVEVNSSSSLLLRHRQTPAIKETECATLLQLRNHAYNFLP